MGRGETAGGEDSEGGGKTNKSVKKTDFSHIVGKKLKERLYEYSKLVLVFVSSTAWLL